MELDSVLCDPTWASYTTIDANIFYTEMLMDQTMSRKDTYGSLPLRNLQVSMWSMDFQNGTYTDDRLPNSDNIVGMALNGVFLFAGTSEYGYDAFFPKAWGNLKNPQAV